MEQNQNINDALGINTNPEQKNENPTMQDDIRTIRKWVSYFGWLSIISMGLSLLVWLITLAIV